MLRAKLKDSKGNKIDYQEYKGLHPNFEIGLNQNKRKFDSHIQGEDNNFSISGSYFGPDVSVDTITGNISRENAFIKVEFNNGQLKAEAIYNDNNGAFVIRNGSRNYGHRGIINNMEDSAFEAISSCLDEHTRKLADLFNRSIDRIVPLDHPIHDDRSMTSCKEQGGAPGYLTNFYRNQKDFNYYAVWEPQQNGNQDSIRINHFNIDPSGILPASDSKISFEFYDDDTKFKADLIGKDKGGYMGFSKMLYTNKDESIEMKGFSSNFTIFDSVDRLRQEIVRSTRNKGKEVLDTAIYYP